MAIKTSSQTVIKIYMFLCCTYALVSYASIIILICILEFLKYINSNNKN